jgi:murein tripeptide amidase MpaA
VPVGVERHAWLVVPKASADRENIHTRANQHRNMGMPQGVKAHTRQLLRSAHSPPIAALVSDFNTANSAYEEAVKRRPGKRITLRQKARVIKKSR